MIKALRACSITNSDHILSELESKLFFKLPFHQGCTVQDNKSAPNWIGQERLDSIVVVADSRGSAGDPGALGRMSESECSIWRRFPCNVVHLHFLRALLHVLHPLHIVHALFHVAHAFCHFRIFGLYLQECPRDLHYAMLSNRSSQWNKIKKERKSGAINNFIRDDWMRAGSDQSKSGT